MKQSRSLGSPVLFFRQKFDDYSQLSVTDRNDKAKATVSYIVRKEAQHDGEIEKAHETRKSKAISTFRYATRSSATSKNVEERTGAFGQSGLFNEKELKECERQLIKNEGIMWSGVFSLPDFETANQLNLNTEQDFQQLLAKVMPDYLQSVGLQPDNISWFGSYHVNTDNPHCHIMYWEKVTTRTTGVMQKNFEKQFKKLVAKELGLHNEVITLFEQVDNQEKIIREKIANVCFVDDSFVVKKISSLIEQLPEGRLQYNSKICKPLRPLVDEITEYLLVNYASDDYLEFHDVQSKIIEHEQTIYGEQLSNPERKQQELKERIGNYIFSQLKKIEQFEISASLISRVNSGMLFRDVDYNRKFKVRQTMQLFKKLGYSDGEIIDATQSFFKLSASEIDEYSESIKSLKPLTEKQEERMEEALQKEDAYLKQLEYVANQKEKYIERLGSAALEGKLFKDVTFNREWKQRQYISFLKGINIDSQIIEKIVRQVFQDECNDLSLKIEQAYSMNIKSMEKLEATLHREKKYIERLEIQKWSTLLKEEKLEQLSSTAIQALEGKLFKDVTFNREWKQKQYISFLKTLQIEDTKIIPILDNAFELSASEIDKCIGLIEQSYALGINGLDRLEITLEKDQQFFERNQQGLWTNLLKAELIAELSEQALEGNLFKDVTFNREYKIHQYISFLKAAGVDNEQIERIIKPKFRLTKEEGDCLHEQIEQTYSMSLSKLEKLHGFIQVEANYENERKLFLSTRSKTIKKTITAHVINGIQREIKQTLNQEKELKNKIEREIIESSYADFHM
ncbi:MAG: relaxase MobL [Culicoidibacterales bacterium]